MHSKAVESALMGWCLCPKSASQAPQPGHPNQLRVPPTLGQATAYTAACLPIADYRTYLSCRLLYLPIIAYIAYLPTVAYLPSPTYLPLPTYCCLPTVDYLPPPTYHRLPNYH